MGQLRHRVVLLGWHGHVGRRCAITCVSPKRGTLPLRFWRSACRSEDRGVCGPQSPENVVLCRPGTIRRNVPGSRCGVPDSRLINRGQNVTLQRPDRVAAGLLAEVGLPPIMGDEPGASLEIPDREAVQYTRSGGPSVRRAAARSLTRPRKDLQECRAFRCRFPSPSTKPSTPPHDHRRTQEPHRPHLGHVLVRRDLQPSSK